MLRPARSSDVESRIRANLRATRLFATWPDAVIDRLCAASELQVYADGETVCRADEPPVGIHVVVEGFLETSRTWASGRRVVFDYHMPGQILNIIPVTDGDEQIFDGIARGPLTLIFIPRETFLAIMHSNPALMFDVAQLLCRRMRVSYRRHEMEVLNSLQARIAKLLIYFARGHQDGDNDDVMPVKTSQDTLAAMLGVSRQSVNRELVPMIRSGVLARRYRGIEILDLERLFAIAQAEENLNKSALDAFKREPHLHRATD